MRFGSSYLGIVLTIAMIFALGLVMVYNTSSAEILDRSLDKRVDTAFLRQIGYGLASLAVAFFIYRLRLESLFRMSPLFLMVGALFLILVFVPGLSRGAHGAHRWIGLGPLSFQPSEFVKYLLPLVYIHKVSKDRSLILQFSSFGKLIALLGSVIFLVMIEPDNGAAFVMSCGLVPLFFVSGVRLKFWALPLLVLAALAVAVAFSHPYVRGRIEVYLHPEKDLQGKGHQPHQAKIALGSGKITGRGPGASLQKFTYLPEAQNDYIAAIYAEEFGFLGVLFLILLYMLFAFFGFSIAFKAKNEEARLAAMAITFLIALQAFFNLGVASGLLPSKGVNLPFFSQGGTSLIANFIAVALLLKIAKESSEEAHRAIA